MLNGMPVLRLEIDRMRERITHMLVMREDELSDAVSAAIDNAVASFPFEAEVERVVHDETRKALEHYFRMGDGRRAIDSVISTAFGGRGDA